MKRTLRTAITSASLLVGALAFAAPASAAPSPPVAQPAQSAQPAPAAHVHAHRAHNAPGDLLGDALSDVTLRPDQRAAVDQVKKDASAKRAAVKKANKALLEALAAQVQAGAFDRAALESSVDDVTSAVADEAKAQRASLDKLHALLDKTQRIQLASAMEARLARDAREAVGGDKRAARDEFRKLAGDVKLTPEQRKAVSAFLKEPAKDAKDVKEEREHHAQAKEREKKQLDAFRADKYQADQSLPAAAARLNPPQDIARLLTVTQHLVPLLTPEQRTVAADKLRERADGNGSLKL